MIKRWLCRTFGHIYEETREIGGTSLLVCVRCGHQAKLDLLGNFDRWDQT